MADLAGSWIRRKQFEARILAKEIGQLFGGASDGTGPREYTPPGYKRVTPAAMLANMGISLK